MLFSVSAFSVSAAGGSASGSMPSWAASASTSSRDPAAGYLYKIIIPGSGGHGGFRKGPIGLFYQNNILTCTVLAHRIQRHGKNVCFGRNDDLGFCLASYKKAFRLVHGHIRRFHPLKRWGRCGPAYQGSFLPPRRLLNSPPCQLSLFRWHIPGSSPKQSAFRWTEWWPRLLCKGCPH